MTSDEQELRELQDPESWDLDAAELHPPVEHPRSVVSVSFSSAEFHLLDEAAERTGKRLTDFIRTAALKAAREPSVLRKATG